MRAITKVIAIGCTIAISFVGSRALAKSTFSRVNPPVVLDSITTDKGDFADVVFHQDQDGPVKLRSLLMLHPSTVVVILGEGCASCSRELPVWNELVSRIDKKTYKALAICAKEFSGVKEFEVKALNFDRTYLCDSNMYNSWNVREFPSVVVFSGGSKTPTLVVAGAEAVSKVEAYFSVSGASKIQ